VKQRSRCEIEDLFLLGNTPFIAAEEGMAPFFQREENAPAAIVHQFRQVGEFQRTRLAVFLLLAAKNPDGEEEIPENLHQFPLAVAR
jgi:hypothetical protein